MQEQGNKQSVTLSERFKLNISSQDYLAYYRGEAKWVIAISDRGLKVQFPANLLAPFVSHNGVHGTFILSYTDEGKLISLKRE